MALLMRDAAQGKSLIVDGPLFPFVQQVYGIQVQLPHSSLT